MFICAELSIEIWPLLQSCADYRFWYILNDFDDAKRRFSEVHKLVARQAKSPHCMLCVSNVFKAHTASVQTCGTSILGSCGTNPKKFWMQPCATSGLEKDLMRSYSHVILISYMYCSHYWLMAEGPEPAPQMFGSMQIAISSYPSSKALSRWQIAQGQGGIKETLQGWTLHQSQCLEHKTSFTAPMDLLLICLMSEDVVYQYFSSVWCRLCLTCWYFVNSENQISKWEIDKIGHWQRHPRGWRYHWLNSTKVELLVAWSFHSLGAKVVFTKLSPRMLWRLERFYAVAMLWESCFPRCAVCHALGSAETQNTGWNMAE